MKDRLTLETLMREVGCSQYPRRWNDIFDDAMAAYDRDGCEVVKPEFYERLNEKYGCFNECGFAFRQAAERARDDELLCRFLVLLSMALQDKTHKAEDLQEFRRPVTPPGKDPAAYEMATALAQCSQYEACAAELRSKGIPDRYINAVLSNAAKGVMNYIWRHDGAIGYDILSWGQLYMQCELFPIGRLEMQFFAKCKAQVTVLQNEAGETVPLANELAVHRSGVALGSLHAEDEAGSWIARVEEDETGWTGHPFGSDGLVQRETVTLPKSAWKKVLETGDPVISVHIPPTGKLTKELIDDTIRETKEFAAAYFPDFRYKAFMCHSWLMSPQLDTLLGAETNIVQFSRRFRRVTGKSRAEDVFSFVFLKPDMNFELRELPENTTLERALKHFYLDGNALYEMYGYFFA